MTEFMASVIVVAIVSALTYLAARVDVLLFGVALLVFVAGLFFLAAYSLIHTLNEKD